MPATDPHDRGAARVVALTAGTLGLVLACVAVAGLLGLTPAQALGLSLLVPAGLSTAAALGVACVLARAHLDARRTLSPEPRTTVARAPESPRPPSARRRQAETQVSLREAGLLRAVELGADETDLMRHALALHEARLQLAQLLLAEDGVLPRALEDELLVAHRGTSAWLRAQTS